jgi:hypothetical protein
LGEFLPIGQLFTLGSLLKLQKPKFWATCIRVKHFVLILKDIGLGYILGDFFTSSSGHPGAQLTLSAGRKELGPKP